jgi:hypothetical protein
MGFAVFATNHVRRASGRLTIVEQMREPVTELP